MISQVATTEEAKALADERHIEYEARHKRGDILNLFFEEYVEEHLIQPTFIMDHPIEISPLTKKKPENPDYVERFELFITGREMCNAYSELNDGFAAFLSDYRRKLPMVLRAERSDRSA